MRNDIRYIRAAAIAAVFVLLTALASVSADAAPIPWRDQRVSMVAREQPVRDFLRDFFAGQGLAVNVSEAVTGAVNGTFRGAPDRVFADVAKAYALLYYYDGSAVYVYASSEATSRTVTLAPTLVPAVVRSLDATNMYDARNTFQAMVNEGVVVANGTRRFVDQVQQVARAVQSQAAATPSTFRVFRLRYAWASDVTLSYANRQMTIPGVASTLRRLLGAGAPGGTYLESTDKSYRPVATRLGGTGLAAAGEPRTPAPALPGMPPPAGVPGQAPVKPESSQTSSPEEFYAVPEARASADGATARIEADSRLNAVIVRDTRERMPYYEELIAALDVEQQLIEIQATIIDVNSDRAQDLGINWRFSGKHADVLFGKGDSSDLGLQRNPAAITPSAAGLAVSTVIGDASAFISRINALANENAARVVARPQVLTLGNIEAILENNQTFYVKVPGAYQVDLFNVVAGTTLKVTPHVVNEGGQTLIRLLVNIEDGGFDNTPGATVDQLPVVTKSAINTQAMIVAGESLLIGGMVREQKSKNVSKVPVLGDVPLLGNLFRTTHDATAKSERMFLISPRIVTSQRNELGEPPVRVPPRAPDPADTGTLPLQPLSPQPGQPQPRANQAATILPRDTAAVVQRGGPAAVPLQAPVSATPATAARAPAPAVGSVNASAVPPTSVDRVAPAVNRPQPRPPVAAPAPLPAPERNRRDLIPASNPNPGRSVYDMEG